MKKVLHEYKNVQVPAEAKQAVDDIWKKVKAVNPRARKADVWLIAVNNVTLDSVIEGTR